jgi:hypothetical protein
MTQQKKPSKEASIRWKYQSMEKLSSFQPNPLSHLRPGLYRKATSRRKSHLLLRNKKAVNVKDRAIESMKKSTVKSKKVGATIDLHNIHIRGHLQINCVKNLKNTIKPLKKSPITQRKFQAQKIVRTLTTLSTQSKRIIALKISININKNRLM